MKISKVFQKKYQLIIREYGLKLKFVLIKAYNLIKLKSIIVIQNKFFGILYKL